jgi:hypothetical protein
VSDWLGKLLSRLAGAIVVLTILALLMRVVYSLIAPALPSMVGLAFVLFIIVWIIRRRQGW